jgi:hypothetical protein
MNIFKAIGTVVNSAVAVVVRALKSVENVMEVVEITTDNLVDETKLENAETSAINKARLAALEKRLAKEAAELDKE